MAYIIGLCTKEERETLERRGWEIEEPPAEMGDYKACDPGSEFIMVWVDSSIFDVMSGPDWATKEEPCTTT